MKEWFRQIKEILRHVGIRSIALAFVALFVIMLIASIIGNNFYVTEKRVLNLQGELNARNAAADYDRYLHTRSNIVTLVGYGVNDMLKSGARNSVILDYLTDQTGYITASIDPNSTGLYGWFNNEYLDGSGWMPGKDYVATERPWYRETLSSDTKITFVDPYLDAQTNTVMMTVSTLMEDGVNVLAMDVSLEPIQKIVEEVAESVPGSKAFVINNDGFVVAHSDIDQLGKNYLEEGNSSDYIVAKKLLVDKLAQFYIDTEEGSYSIYSDILEGGWYSVSMINADIWYQPLQRTIITFGIIFVLILLALVYNFLHSKQKNLTMEKLHARIDEEEKRGDELQVLSETDRMTGLYDRVGGKRRVDEALERGDEGLFMEFDIDNFKSFNDTYGHQAGDEVIMAVADAMRSAFRTNDITMRLGGDEFGVFALYITDRMKAEAIIKRLFDLISEIKIEDIGDKKITLSVGAVFCRKNQGKTFSELYAAADDALYKSKKRSGNSLTFARSK